MGTDVGVLVGFIGGGKSGGGGRCRLLARLGGPGSGVRRRGYLCHEEAFDWMAFFGSKSQLGLGRFAHRWFVRWLVGSLLVRSLVCSLVHSLVRSLVCSFVRSFVGSFDRRSSRLARYRVAVRVITTRVTKLLSKFKTVRYRKIHYVVNAEC